MNQVVRKAGPKILWWAQSARRVVFFAVPLAILASTSVYSADVVQRYVPPPPPPVYSADVVQRYVPPQPPPVVVPDTCYAVFYRHRNGTGPSVRRIGPEDVAVIRHLAYPDGHSLNGRVRSVATGPGARIVLYNRKHYHRMMMDVGPGSLANLRSPVMDSYQLRCTAPPPPVYAPPPYYK